MRAAVPVGAGTSTQFTQNETKTLGTAYDDQMQQITGHLEADRMFDPVPNMAPTGAFSQGTSSSREGAAASTAVTTQAMDFDSADSPDARTGTTTHGKQVAFNYILRAQ